MIGTNLIAMLVAKVQVCSTRPLWSIRILVPLPLVQFFEVRKNKRLQVCSRVLVDVELPDNLLCKLAKTLLLEDMPEDIDPSIEAIVSKNVYRADGILKINLGANAVDYHEDFKLLMTTKLSNPHFLPEVSIKVAVINFTVTFDGLDD